MWSFKKLVGPVLSNRPFNDIGVFNQFNAFEQITMLIF